MLELAKGRAGGEPRTRFFHADVREFSSERPYDVIVYQLGNSWLHEMHLQSPGIYGYNLFGKAVDIDDSVMIIGEPSSDITGSPRSTGMSS